MRGWRVTSQMYQRARTRLMQLQYQCCAYCGREFSPDLPATLDHVLPRSKGGSNHYSNLVAACEPCNLGKSARFVYPAYPHDLLDPIEAMMKVKKK